MISKINIIMIIIFCLLTITCSKGKKEFEEAMLAEAEGGA